MANDHSSDAELRARRAYAFGAQADAYDELRPGYPDSAVRWALEPVADRRPIRVLDLAAGTGKLTIVAVRLGADVVAVEPDPAMLERLRRRLPDVRALPGTAEQIPLRDGAVNAVLVGQAMHWFDRDRALPEIARVLAPGGVLAALWNSEDSSVDWVAGLVGAARSSSSLDDLRTRATTMEPHPLFPVIDDGEFSNTVPHDVESLVAMMATHSHILVLDDDERRRLLDRLRAYLHERPETATGRFDLPLITIARRAVRL
jgi:SAM-dependent methyltransferase